MRDAAAEAASESPHGEARFRRLHPATAAVAFVGVVRQFLVPGLLVMIFGSSFVFELALMWFSIPAFAWSLLRYARLDYAIDADQLRVREGWLSRSVRRIPLARIQSLETRRGLVHRLFDVDDLIVQTGASGEPEAVLSAIGSAEVARIDARVKRARGEPVVAREDAAAEDPPWHAGWRDLVAYGSAINRGWVLLFLVAGLLWQADLLTWGRAEDVALSIVRRLELSTAGAWMLLAPLYVLAFWLTLRLCSIAWALVSLHGFSFRHRDDQVHLAYGLLFHRRIVLPERRFHIFQIDETWRHRWSGTVTLSAWTAGQWSDDEESTGDSEIDEYFNTQLLHPWMAREQAASLVATLTDEPAWEDLDWRRLAPGALRRTSTLWLSIASVPCLALSIVLFPWGLAAWPVGLGLAAYASWVRARQTRYAVTAKGIWLRTGYLHRTWRMVAYRNVQAVEVVVSPFDRRHGMAGLRIDAPSAPAADHAIGLPLLERHEAEATARRVAEETARHALAW